MLAMLLLPKPRNTESVRNIASVKYRYYCESCTFPLLKQPNNTRDLQCISKQNIHHVRTIA